MFLWGVFDGAIVSITTKTGDELDQALAVAPAIDVSIASPLGYQTPAEFYAPAYATEKARRSMVPDALLEPDCQARRYGTGHRRVLHL